MTKWVSISDIADREALRRANKQAAADIAALQAENERLRAKLADVELTLVTLCDMVLGEDAGDRSDDALIRAVGRLQGQIVAAEKEKEYLFRDRAEANETIAKLYFALENAVERLGELEERLGGDK